MRNNNRQQEKDWHDFLFWSRRKSTATIHPAILARYLNPPRQAWFAQELMFGLLGDLRGKRVLYFGCGDDHNTAILALKGARVWAFDLSYQAILRQREIATDNDVSGRVHTVVSAGEELPFAAECFDVVFGNAILHHLPDHLPALPWELNRVLKPDGFALFAEPVSRSRVLKWILDKLPGHQAISPGERQLTDEDLAHFDACFDVQTHPFCGLARLDRFLLSGPLEHAGMGRRALIYCLHGLDQALLSLPPLQSWAGTVVMKLSPKLVRTESR